MKPIRFPEANQVFQKPPDMTDEQCVPLPVHNDGAQLVSCWQLSPEEKLKAVFFGKVWISVAGQSQPPIWLIADETVFENEPQRDQEFLDHFKRRKIRRFLEENFDLAAVDQGMAIKDVEQLSRWMLKFFDFIFES